VVMVRDAGDVPSECLGIRQECVRRTSRGSRGVGGTFRVGAGRWPFPPGIRRSPLQAVVKIALVVFAPLQSSILSPWPLGLRPPLMGFVFPSIDVLPGVHSRRDDLAVLPTSGPGLPTWTLVPSSRFCTASTAFSALILAPKLENRGVAGLLHPAADPGVRRVSGHPLRPPLLVCRAPPSPRRVSYPSKDSPRLQPHHVTMAVAPLPFPSSACAVERRLRGFAPLASP